MNEVSGQRGTIYRVTYNKFMRYLDQGNHPTLGNTWKYFPLGGGRDRWAGLYKGQEAEIFVTKDDRFYWIEAEGRLLSDLHITIHNLQDVQLDKTSVEPSKPVESVEAPVTPVITSEPVEELTEDDEPVTAVEVLAANDVYVIPEAEHDWEEELAGEIIVINGPEEDIWDVLPVACETVTLPSLEAKEEARCWTGHWADKKTYNYNQAARDAGLDHWAGVLVEVAGVDGPALFLQKDQKVVKIILLTDESAPTLIEVDGRAYSVPPMPSHVPTYTPISDLVQGIFEEAEKTHVIPYEADASCDEKRLNISKEQASYLMSVLEFSDEWVLSGVNYEAGRGMKTKWAEYVRDEFGEVEVIAVEPINGVVVLYGAEAAVFANVPSDYLANPDAFNAVVTWCMDLEEVAA